MRVQLPIPETLEKVLRNEENNKSIVEESRKLIYENPKEYDDHLRLISDSLVFIEYICLKRNHFNEDELVLRA